MVGTGRFKLEGMDWDLGMAGNTGKFETEDWNKRLE
jgi:hypothetical protein